MTTTDFEEKLRQYADVIVQVGVGVQPGQKVRIAAPLEATPLVRQVAASAYTAGSPLVEVDWHDDYLNLIRLQNAQPDTLDAVSQWRADGLAQQASEGGTFIYLSAPNPDLLEGQDPDAVMTMRRASMKALKALTDMRIREQVTWVLAAVPGADWTNKVFADIDPAQREARAWDTIFDICRITGSDPLAGWHDHIETLKRLAARLTIRAYDALHFTGPGTDLTIGLADNHIWIGGASRAESGVEFAGNIPTEEIFTAPHRERVNGTVSTTKPLNYNGSLIDGISLHFEEGRVTHVEAKQGEDILRKMIETDEGASHLGEIALVPNSSPISQTGRIFYSSLIDENAACHMAVGASYPINVQGGATMSDDELHQAGVNTSMVHTDMMIGSGELDIDGHTAEGGIEPLMRGGEWVIEG